MTNTKHKEFDDSFNEPFGDQEWNDIGADLRIKIRGEFSRFRKHIKELQEENKKLKFEIESKQRPLSEQVLSLTIANEQLKAQLLEHIKDANQIGLSEFKKTNQKLTKALDVAKEALNDCASWGDESSWPDEPGALAVSRKALKEIEEILK